MDIIYIIKIKKKFGYWFFNDEKRGLYEHPFGEGFSEFMSMISDKIDDKELNIVFSSSYFKSCEFEFVKIKEEFCKYWYKCDIYEGWISDVILRYFDEIPDIIYAKFKKV